MGIIDFLANKMMAGLKKEQAQEFSLQIVQVPPTIEIGSKWYLASEPNDPWGSKKYLPATIIDVKDGWVRYHLNCMFNDNRKPIEDFLRIYRKG